MPGSFDEKTHSRYSSEIDSTKFIAIVPVLVVSNGKSI